MALPPNVITITVTGTYVGMNGVASSGTVSFTPNTNPFTDVAAPAFIVGTTLSATLDSSGHFSIVLPTTDNGHMSPQNWVYSVQETLTSDSRTWLVQIPSSLGSTVDLATLPPVVPASTPATMSTIYGVLNQPNLWTGENEFIGSATELAIQDTGTGVTPASFVGFATNHAATGKRFLGLEGQGDTDNRFAIDYDGKLQWAPSPGGTFDTNLARSAAGQLAINGSPIITGATQAVDWLNVKDYGATGNGVTDDTAAIQAALNAIPGTGGVVYFPADTYAVSAPVVPKSGTLMLGEAFYAMYPGGTTNATGTVLKATAGFTGAAIIVVDGSSSAVNDVRIAGLLLSGANLSGGTTGGFLAQGNVPSLVLRDVVTSHTPGTGVSLQTASGNHPVVYLERVTAWYGGVHGIDVSVSDSSFLECMAFNATQNNWNFQNINNCVFVACRAEHAGQYGFFLGNTNPSSGLVFSACSTDQNNWDGFRVDTCTGQGPVQLIGCSFRRDGNNAGAGSTQYAGVTVTASTLPVIVDGTTVQAMRGDTAGYGPYYGISVTTSSFVTVAGGYFGTVSGGTPLHWDSAGVFEVSPGVLSGSNNQIGFPGTVTTGVQNFSVASSGYITGKLGVGQNTVPGNGLSVTANGNAAVTVNQQLAAGQGIAVNLADASSRALQVQATGDTVNRFIIDVNGAHQWGSGSGNRDAQLARTGAGKLTFSNPQAGAFNLVVSGTLTAPGVTDWINAVTQYGADPTGVADSTTAIQNALNACPLGGVVYLGAGTSTSTDAVYTISAPLTVPPQVWLLGSHSSHIDSPTVSIIPSAGFTGVSVVLMVDQATGGYPVTSAQQRVSNITLDGLNLTGSTIDGIQAQGKVHGVILEDLQIRNMPNHGIATISNGSGTAYSWRGTRLVAGACSGYGFSIGMTDCTWIDLEAIGGGKSGYFLGGLANSHFAFCRAEFNAFDGFTITGGGSGTGSGGCTFTSCSTDRNTQNGVHFSGATGDTPFIFTNLMTRRDGSNGGAGGGGYAGFNVSGGSVPPVTVNGMTCYPGVNDDGSGTSSPQYGFSITGSSKNVTLNAGFLQAATAGVHDDGSNSNWYRSPNILTATGPTNTPVYDTSYPWSTNGTGAITLSTADVRAFNISNSAANSNNALLTFTTGGGAGDYLIKAVASGDTSTRFGMNTSGQLNFGGGVTSFDATLSRTGAGILTATGLAVTNTFSVGSTSSFTGNITSSGTLNVNRTTDSAAVNASYTITSNSTNAAYSYTAFAATGRMLGAVVTGDASGRYVMLADGTMQWGAGSTSRDVQLARTGTGTLTVTPQNGATTTSLVLSSGSLTANSVALSEGAAAGGVLTVTNTTSTPTAASTLLYANAAADKLLGLRVTGDTVSRLAVDSNGQHLWGPGSSTAGDTNLYRSAANVLTTDNNLSVGGHALGAPQPTDHGLVAWTTDPAMCNTGTAATSGTLYLSAIYVNRSVSITKIYWGVNTAAQTATAGDNFIALYSSAGTLLQSVGVDARVTTTGMFTETIGSTALTPGFYWIGFLFNTSGSPATCSPYRGPGDLNGTLVNAGLTSPATYRYAANGTLQTALPSPITPSSNTASQHTFWAAVS